MYSYIYDKTTGVIKGMSKGMSGVSMKNCSVLTLDTLYDANCYRVDLETLELVPNGQQPLQRNPRA
jgi:hypothetical protein